MGHEWEETNEEGLALVTPDGKVIETRTYKHCVKCGFMYHPDDEASELWMKRFTCDEMKAMAERAFPDASNLLVS